ncbi:hypothetical protein ABTM45_19635, partial [Acinetobacter baumannii]
DHLLTDDAVVAGLIVTDPRGEVLVAVATADDISRRGLGDLDLFKVHLAGDDSRLFVGRPASGLLRGKTVVPVTRRMNRP